MSRGRTEYSDRAQYSRPRGLRALRLACEADPWSLGIQYPDGSVDGASLYVHARQCPDCGVYLQAFTVRMSEHDPEPPRLREEVEQEYVSPKQLAARLGKSTRSVRRWIAAGAFPHYPLWDGRTVLVRWADVESWLARVRVEGRRP